MRTDRMQEVEKQILRRTAKNEIDWACSSGGYITARIYGREVRVFRSGIIEITHPETQAKFEWESLLGSDIYKVAHASRRDDWVQDFFNDVLGENDD